MNRMTRVGWLSVMTTLLGWGFTTAVSGRQPAPEPAAGGASVAAIQAVWKGRQDRIHSARFALQENRTTHRAYFDFLAKGPSGQGLRIPDKDMQVDFPSSVMLRDHDFKYEYTTKQWSMVSGKSEVVNYSASSTAGGQSFSTGRPEESGPALVSSSNRRQTSDETVLSLLPLMLTVRPVESYQRKLSDYALTGRTVTVDGHPCTELSQGVRAGGRIEYLYLDPNCEWVLRRLDLYAKDALLKRVSAEYEKHPSAGWIPTRWSYVRQTANGTPTESGRVTVTKSEINAGIPPDDFLPSYSPGTVVLDDRKGAGNETLEVVRDDGTRGVAIPLAQHPTYEQLTGANQAASRQRIWLLIIAAAGLVIAGVVVFRYRRRSRAAS